MLNIDEKAIKNLANKKDRNYDCVNLYRLLLLRNILGIFELFIVIIANHFFFISLKTTVFLIIISLMAGMNVATWQWIKSGKKCDLKLFLFQLIFDITCFSILMYFSGGAENPFIGLYILYIAISSTVLKSLYVWIVSTYSAIWYTVLLFFYSPLIITGYATILGLDPMVFGMWLRFLVTAFFISYFVVQMVKNIHARDAIINKKNQEDLHNQYVVSIGLMAASSAHELSTPLTSINLLVNELEDTISPNSEQQELFDIIKSQIFRCRELLDNMLITSGKSFTKNAQNIKVRTYLNNIIEYLSKTSKNISINLTFPPAFDRIEILNDSLLTQALTEILNNALDASSEDINLIVALSNDTLIFEVQDRGAGMPDFVQKNINHPGFSSKPQGHGLGLYLAKSAIQKMNGCIEFGNMQPKGSKVTIKIPINELIINGIPNEQADQLINCRR